MFVCKLKKLRLDNGVSQKELSTKTGIRYPTISEMERGTTKSCSLENLDKLCHFFDCTLNDIYGFTPVQASEIVMPLEAGENGKVNPFIEYTSSTTSTRSPENEIETNQISALEKIYMNLDPISQAKLLVYADELKKQSNKNK